MVSTGSSKSGSKPLTGSQRNNIFNWGLSSIGNAMGYTPTAFSGSQPQDGSIMSRLKDAAVAGPQKGTADYSGMFPGYTAIGYEDAPQARTLSGGDYDRLEQSIVDSRWAPLQRYETLDRQRLDEDLNRRGIYTSGVATEAQNDLTERFAPQYAAAAAEAATQRYGLQANELSQLNALEAQEAAQRNAFRQNQALQEYNSKWAPYEYLMGLYNQTGGAVSKGNSANFSIL